MSEAFRLRGAAWLLVVLVLVALADIVINDLLPERWQLLFVLRHRHLCYIGIALLNLSYVFAMASANSLSVLAARYLLDATFCTFVAWGHVLSNQPQRNYPYVERRGRRTPGA